MELYPIRIDVSYPPPPKGHATTSSNQQQQQQPPPTGQTSSSSPPMIRIIDTLVIDPKLIRNHYGTVSKQIQLFTQLAHSVIADSFVVGITKTTSTTTTTGNSNNPTTENPSSTVPSSSSSTNTEVPNQTTEFTGRYSIIDTTIVTSNQQSINTSSVSTSSSSSKMYYESLLQQAIYQIQNQYTIIYEYEQLIVQFQYYYHSQQRKTINHIVPIRIRMELPSNNNNNSVPIRYHDDFQWDILSSTSTSSSTTSITPIQMAQSIVQDLQLSYDTVPIITIHILEQIIQFIHNKIKNYNLSDTSNTSTITTSEKYYVEDTNEEEDDDSYIDVDDGYMMGPIPLILQKQQQQQNDNTNLKTNSSNTKHISAAWEISNTIRTTNMNHIETTIYK